MKMRAAVYTDCRKCAFGLEKRGKMGGGGWACVGLQVGHVRVVGWDCWSWGFCGGCDEVRDMAWIVVYL
jgi:hypothetical protein